MQPASRVMVSSRSILAYPGSICYHCSWWFPCLCLQACVEQNCISTTIKRQSDIAGVPMQVGQGLSSPKHILPTCFLRTSGLPEPRVVTRMESQETGSPSKTKSLAATMANPARSRVSFCPSILFVQQCGLVRVDG
jgi:hypothetical protein